MQRQTSNSLQSFVPVGGDIFVSTESMNQSHSNEPSKSLQSSGEGSGQPSKETEEDPFSGLPSSAELMARPDLSQQQQQNGNQQPHANAPHQHPSQHQNLQQQPSQKFPSQKQQQLHPFSTQATPAGPSSTPAGTMDNPFMVGIPTSAAAQAASAAANPFAAPNTATLGTTSVSAAYLLNPNSPNNGQIHSANPIFMQQQNQLQQQQPFPQQQQQQQYNQQQSFPQQHLFQPPAQNPHSQPNQILQPSFQSQQHFLNSKTHQRHYFQNHSQHPQQQHQFLNQQVGFNANEV